MPDLSMNTDVKHEPRTVDLVGFHGNFHVSKVSPNGMPTVPYSKPAPLTNEIDPSSNTHMVDVGPAAGDINRRTRNG